MPESLYCCTISRCFIIAVVADSAPGLLKVVLARTGGRGRIRTSVARKERQIYSLLVLATHPPVPREHRDTVRLSPSAHSEHSTPVLPSHSELNRTAFTRSLRNAERARVRRHQPCRFCREEFVRNPAKKPRSLNFSWRRESNPRPSDYKSDALPAELRQHWQTAKEYHRGNQIASRIPSPARGLPFEPPIAVVPARPCPNVQQAQQAS